MAKHSNSRRSFCRGTLRGRCLRRAAEFGIFTDRALSAWGGKAAGAAKTAKRIASHAAAMGDLRCRVARGLACRHAPLKPSYENRELRVGKTLVRRYRNRCKQTKFLEVAQAQGWPDLIAAPLDSPSELGPEHGLRDLVYRLNQQPDSPIQVHFWCDGSRVRWAIVRPCRAGKQ